MITALNYVQALAFYNIYEAMFNGNPAAPKSGKLPFEWFGLPNSFIGRAHRIPDKFIDTMQYLLILFLPIEIVLPRIRLPNQFHINPL